MKIVIWSGEALAYYCRHTDENNPPCAANMGKMGGLREILSVRSALRCHTISLGVYNQNGIAPSSVSGFNPFTAIEDILSA